VIDDTWTYDVDTSASFRHVIEHDSLGSLYKQSTSSSRVRRDKGEG
jgi:hypothetical protein